MYTCNLHLATVCAQKVDVLQKLINGIFMVLYTLFLLLFLSQTSFLYFHVHVC